ncbi:hypothetical protein M011DRAFT_464618 [Sporormia fimetaria CBS 119925]|uniref:Uncharacterized protein n=1 Tax=Sporormia fimetaria CBS 119925 TaxID=1340428 RepID=A0A6A6VLX8_9PLEO|nr:hypothetical protein M011DRAFT_464618 [Sporormia fimetaria CBS 119925]
MSSPDRPTLLRTTTTSFCSSLLSPPPPSALLSRFFTSSPKITEHGPTWATSRLPFLGRTFSGTSDNPGNSSSSCVSYFELLSSTLEMKLPSDAFPDRNGFIVDAEADMVSVVGKGRFVAKKTGKGWDEQFVYRFSGFDEEGRIGHWEIWADPLSAWVAVGGKGEGEKGGKGEGEKGGKGEKEGGGVEEDGGKKGEGVLEGAGYAS